MRIGPTFSEELRQAGLLGLPFSWGTETGEIYFAPDFDPDKKAQVLDVLARHDPDKSLPDPHKFLGLLKQTFQIADRIRLSQKYPWFLDAVRGGNWSDVQVYINDAIANGHLTQDDINKIQEAASSSGVPITINSI